MRNLLPLSFIFILLVLGCAKTRNEVLLDSLIPPDEQLIKISADDLASDFTRGKKRSLTQDNDADKKYSGKWVKVTGIVDNVYDKGDGFGYNITLDTFGGDPRVECIGNFQENDPKILPKENQEIIIVGKLVSSGNASTLYLNPCKFIK
jgi:hypothetical protein